MLLYKYTSLENASKIISERRLKFTNPSEFNDPFDCNLDRLDFDLEKVDEDFDAYHNKFKRIAFEYHGERANKINWRDIYRELPLRKVKRTKLCCFSLTNTHPLLWAHYGNKHNGACLVFDSASTNRFVDDSLKIKIEGPVEYKKFERVNFCAGRVEAYRNLFFVKGEDWHYEKEYRIIGLDIQNEFVEFHPSFLVGIIFGMKVSNSAISQFQENLLTENSAQNIEVAIKNNETLEILKWPGSTMDIKGIQISVLSQDPVVAGVLERLFNK